MIALLVGAGALLLFLREERSLTWTEEVKFPDGRLIKLTRHQEFGERDNVPSNYWFQYTDPDSKELVRFHSMDALRTMALFKAELDTYLLLEIADEQFTYRRYNCPNPPYILKRYRGAAWRDVDLAYIPVKKIRVNMTHNLLGAIKTIKERNQHLTIDDTQNLMYRGLKPYVIDFGLMKWQTFGNENCLALRDDLIAK